MTDDRRPDIDELLSLVEVPGPLPDGVEDALWESTAQLYEQRISSRQHESETEIIVETSEPSDRDGGRRTWLLAAAAALVAVLAIGLIVVPRSDDEQEPVTTPAPATSTTTTTTTTTTTVLPIELGSGYFGIVWEDATDPARVNTTEERPTVVDGPLSAQIDAFVITPGPDESPACAEAVEEGATGPGGEERELPDVESCLIVEWHYDIGEDAAGNGGMDARDAITVEGETVEPLVYDLPTTPPGGSSTVSVVFPNLGPGARISIGYEAIPADGGIIFERWEVVVPDAFQPIEWFDDES